MAPGRPGVVRPGRRAVWVARPPVRGGPVPAGDGPPGTGPRARGAVRPGERSAGGAPAGAGVGPRVAPVSLPFMRMSKLFARTLKEAPAEADVASHRLMLRAAYMRRVMAGIYTMLPLGWRVLRKIEAIIREEMDASGAQEIR